VSVEVILPFRGGCEHRARALDWVENGYWQQGWDTRVAEAPPGPWCKAAAVNPAVEASDADIVVMADADVWTDGLAEAVRQVEAGAAWAVPHEFVYRLDREATGRLLNGDCPDMPPDEPVPLDQPAYRGLIGGGVVVAPRDVLRSVPLDPRFVGWGQEDESHALALTHLVGDPWRGTAPLIHFWHPPQGRLCRKRGSVEGWQLRRRYLKARRDPAAMRALIEEIPCRSLPC
jgi:hypothetical protein